MPSIHCQKVRILTMSWKRKRLRLSKKSAKRTKRRSFVSLRRILKHGSRTAVGALLSGLANKISRSRKGPISRQSRISRYWIGRKPKIKSQKREGEAARQKERPR